MKALDSKLDDSHTKCFQALDLAQMGALCYLASAKGDQNTNTSSATFIQIGVTTSIGAKLAECLPWYDVLCLTTTGQSISTDLVLDDDVFKKNSAKYGTACANLKA